MFKFLLYSVFDLIFSIFKYTGEILILLGLSLILFALFFCSNNEAINRKNWAEYARKTHPKLIERNKNTGRGSYQDCWEVDGVLRWEDHNEELCNEAKNWSK